MSENMPSADDVIKFWFDAGADAWFTKDEEFDDSIREKFGPAIETAAAGGLDDWLSDAKGCLGIVLLLDQFTRNINRGSPATWAFDDKALAVAKTAFAEGFDQELSMDERRWFVMPFMHSEDPEMQARCIELADTMDNEGLSKYARHHADIIARFGRFPHRNVVLGRTSSAEEEAYLADDGFKG